MSKNVLTIVTWRSGHAWTASSSLHFSRIVKLALAQCGDHTGK